jgi:hypothetical protein
MTTHIKEKAPIRLTKDCTIRFGNLSNSRSFPNTIERISTPKKETPKSSAIVFNIFVSEFNKSNIAKCPLTHN